VEKMIRACPLSALPRREALRVEAEPPIAVFHTEWGEVTVGDGSAESRDVLAVYRPERTR
jgi:3-phenylpropionate/trans-cinnamate dioxygenase ferredoxin subunit